MMGKRLIVFIGVVAVIAYIAVMTWLTRKDLEEIKGMVDPELPIAEFPTVTDSKEMIYPEGWDERTEGGVPDAVVIDEMLYEGEGISMEEIEEDATPEEGPPTGTPAVRVVIPDGTED
jgi:hypothetical protein